MTKNARSSSYFILKCGLKVLFY